MMPRTPFTKPGQTQCREGALACPAYIAELGLPHGPIALPECCRLFGIVVLGRVNGEL